MIKIIQNIIPLSGYKAITIWPFVFIRKDLYDKFTDVDVYHEMIHCRQQLEMLPVSAALFAVLLFLGCSWWSTLSFGLYYTIYGIEYLIRVALYDDEHTAYRNISMEQEAYLNQSDFHFLSKRKWFGWVQYLTRKTYEKPRRGYTDYNDDNF